MRGPNRAPSCPQPAPRPSLPGPGLPSYPGGDQSQQTLLKAASCAGPGRAWEPGQRRGKARAQSVLPALAAVRWKTARPGPATVGLELCPSPKQSAGTDFTPPRPQGRRPASRPCLAARGRDPRAWGWGRGETTTLDEEEAGPTGNYNSQQFVRWNRGGCWESGSTLLFPNCVGTAIDPTSL